MKTGKWVTSSYMPGDLMIFDFGSPGIDHIGICYAVDKKRGLVFTIEGNTGSTSDADGGAVMERTRGVLSVVGACRPAYTPDKPAAKINQIARREVGTKESPPNSNNVKYNTEYYGGKVSGPNFPWCVAFVWWVFKQAGMSELFFGGGKTASCTTLAIYYGYKKTPSPAQKVPTSELKIGSKGSDVVTLQNRLNALKFPCGKADGDFGRRTQEAVKAFQAAKGLITDGVVGPKTWGALMK